MHVCVRECVCYKDLEGRTQRPQQSPPVWKGAQCVGRMGEEGIFTFHFMCFSVVCILSFAYIHFCYKIIKSMKNLFYHINKYYKIIIDFIVYNIISIL